MSFIFIAGKKEQKLAISYMAALMCETGMEMRLTSVTVNASRSKGLDRGPSQP